jgi:hypothetical protein
VAGCVFSEHGGRLAMAVQHFADYPEHESDAHGHRGPSPWFLGGMVLKGA